MRCPSQQNEKGQWPRSFLDTGVLRLETFFYEDAWRWCVLSGTDAVEAQSAADDEEDAKSHAAAWARERLTTALRQLN